MNTTLKKILILGASLRFIFLFIVIILFRDIFIPYIFSDDIMYEEIARKYLTISDSVFDFNSTSIIGVDQFLQVFWPYVMCFSAKMFGTVYMGRIINCLLSLYNIYQVFILTKIITKDEASALFSAKIMAYLPLNWMICCFPIKDIFLSVGVLYILIFIAKIINKLKINIIEIIGLFLFGVAIYLTRGAVIEFLFIASVIWIVYNLYKNKRVFLASFFIVSVFVILLFVWEDLINAFIIKVEGYGSDEYISSGFLRNIQINKISDIWRLPITYFFAMLQPLALDMFNTTWKDWSNLVSICNITVFPFALGNMIYMFSKKIDTLFWIITFVMYASVFSLSLGIYRHYLFLFPIVMINYSCYRKQRTRNQFNIELIGSLGLFLLVCIISIFRL